MVLFNKNLSLIPKPFDEFFVVCFFAIHQDAYPVYSGRNPGGEYKAACKQCEGKDQLPGRNAKRNTYQHGNGRGERNHAEPKR